MSSGNVIVMEMEIKQWTRSVDHNDILEEGLHKHGFFNLNILEIQLSIDILRAAFF